jgi:hypothetical protein
MISMKNGVPAGTSVVATHVPAVARGSTAWDSREAKYVQVGPRGPLPGWAARQPRRKLTRKLSVRLHNGGVQHRFPTFEPERSASAGCGIGRDQCPTGPWHGAVHRTERLHDAGAAVFLLQRDRSGAGAGERLAVVPR